MPQIAMQNHEILVVIGVILAFMILKPVIENLVARIVPPKQRQSDFMTMQQFLKLCSENRSNCIVLKEFTTKLDGMNAALKVLIIHTVADKAKQDEALRLLH